MTGQCTGLGMLYRAMNQWYVYIICCDGRFLYTGITTDVARRVGEHVSGNKRAAKYTRPFSSIDLVYKVPMGSRSLAAKMEYRIKRLSRQKKERIISRCFDRDELMAFMNMDQGEESKGQCQE